MPEPGDPLPPDRVDALGAGDAHLTAIPAVLLTESEDAELQAVVAEAALELNVPIALVSLVLRNVQFFKAHYGLPPDLRATRATDRDVSFCQFVVRDRAPLQIDDAARATGIPQGLVNSYGIKAYLGFPISAQDHVIGSLCVIDTNPRTFTAQDRDKLARLAEMVNARLDAIAARHSPAAGALSALAAVPAFAEMRNLLMPLSHGVAAAAIAAAEIGASLRLLEAALAAEPSFRRAHAVLKSPGQSLSELLGLLEDVRETSARLERLLLALERGTLEAGAPSCIGEDLDAARTMAEHLTRAAGGLVVEGDGSAMVIVPRPVVVTSIAAALSLVAQAVRGDAEGPAIVVAVTRRDAWVELRLGGQGCTPAASQAIAERLQRLTAAPEVVRVAAEGDRVLLAFRALGRSG